ncbi:MAG: integration host factor subunit beta [Xanthobacteraceae bacterium]|nr:integration host factor subunit beta [Xanthobacteraceae bacterium]
MTIKSQLILRIANAHPHLHRGEIEQVVDGILEKISSALAEGKRVELRNFGIFSVRSRSARMGRNPFTGEPVAVEEKFYVHFSQGRAISDRLNGRTEKRRSRASSKPVIFE